MTDRVRVVTLNVLTLTDADGARRQEVIRRGLPDLRPDIVAGRSRVETEASTADEPFRATAVAAEVLLPAPFGPLLVVHHRGTYHLQREDIRERQAVATARPGRCRWSAAAGSTTS